MSPRNGAALDRLERLVIASVGVTARAVAEAAPDLTLLQWRALVILADTTGGVTVSEVADRIGSRLPATSRLLSRMRARGLVETRKDRSDGRVTTVHLAPAGAELHDRVTGRRRLDLAAALSSAQLDRDGSAVVDRLADALGRLA